MQIEFWSAFILYFCALFTIGYVVHKKHATASEMLMGGRKLNFWVIALSAQASDMSSWMFMAFPMSLFVKGLPQIWIAVGLLIGMYANWHFISKKLRIETERYQAFTLSTFYAKRFQDHRGTIRILSAILTLIFITYYLAAGLISIGILFERLFAFDYTIGVLIATAVMIGYTFVGGFVSVAWVDLFQAIFLLAAIIIVPCVAFTHIDGIASIKTAAAAANIPMTIWPSSFTDIICTTFGWGLGYFGMPHIITKFMGIKDPQELTKSKYLGIGWETLALAAAASVGLIGIAFFQNGGIDNPELVFVQMVDMLFHPFIAGLLLCGVMAATISTMDSQILVSASVITEDLYKQIINPRATSRQEVFIFRIAVIVVAAVAFWISLSRDKTIMDTVYYAWAGLGSSFAPLVLTALYSKSVTRLGAIWGMLAGGLTAALWPILQISAIIPSLIPGFGIGLATIFLVSKFTRQTQLN